MLGRLLRKFTMEAHEKNCAAEEVNQEKSDNAEEARLDMKEGVSSVIRQLMAKDLIYTVGMTYQAMKKFTVRGPYADYSGTDITTTLQPKTSAAAQQDFKDYINNSLDEAFKEESESLTRDEGQKNRIAAALVGGIDKKKNLSFFYMSDLIDTILEGIETQLEELTIDGGLDFIKNNERFKSANAEPESVDKYHAELQASLKAFKKLRILLGPVEFVKPKVSDDTSRIVVNLGDIPISVRYFVEWLTTKMLAKDEVYYPLTKFMNDLFNDLTSNFLNNETCFTYKISQKTRVQQATVTAWSAHTNMDPLTKQLTTGNSSEPLLYSPRKIKAQALGVYETTAGGKSFAFRGHVKDFTKRPILRLSGPPSPKLVRIKPQNAYNYLVYSVSRTMPTELMKGNKNLDARRGIFHYSIGQKNGFIKNIKLSKTSTKYLAEVRFEQEGYDGLEQLRVIYDAQIDSFANVNLVPGTYVFIDPQGFAPGMPSGIDASGRSITTSPHPYGRKKFGLTKLGIGGYYMIVRSEHEFASGKANTILHTKWVNQIDNDAEAQQNE